MIRAEGLEKRFGAVRALNGLSFEVERGETYGLLGPNGAGKTTALRLLSGMLRPSAGRATVGDCSITTQAAAVRRQVGLLTEVPGLYLRLTPAEYLDFFAQVHDLGPRRAARVEEMLRLVGLWEQRTNVMRAFSKGMQQRVAIARTLLQDAPVLLLDEPTAALDPEAAELCARLSIVQHGRQVAQGSPASLRSGLTTTCELRLAAPAPRLSDRLAQLVEITDSSSDTVAYRTSDPHRVNPEVVRRAVAEGADVLSLTEHAPSLEDVYLDLVNRDGHLPDADLPTPHLPPPAHTSEPGGARKALLIARRELRETIRDPNLVLPLVVLPVMIGAMAGMTAFFSFSGQPGAVGTAVTNAALDQLPAAAVQRLGNLPAPSGERTATLQVLLKAFSIPLFWIIPVALTPAVAADSFVGERERASLEPLLATPVSPWQVLLGKLLAATVPAVIGTWIGVLVFWLMTLLSRSALYPRMLLGDGDWVFSLVVLAPLIGLFTAGVAALISTRVSGYRVAYQLNGLIVLPVVLVLIPATAFLFLVTSAAQ